MEHNKSTVELLDHMGEDLDVVNAARVSFDKESESLNQEDINLLDYLIREAHTGPLEQVEFKFRITCPLPIGEQMIRHRTANVNKISYRYVKAGEEEYFVPEVFRKQAKNNKQGSGENFHTAENEKITKKYKSAVKEAYKVYEEMVDLGVAKEMARFILPTAVITKFIWKIDLHNLLHFLKLRLDTHAQKEIQEIAQAMYTLIKPIVPHIIAAWEERVLYAVTFSRGEMTILKRLIADHPVYFDVLNDRDRRILEDKIRV